MHIKPYVVLGLAGACAATSLGFIVVNTDPARASSAVMALAWTSLVLMVLGLVAAVGSICRLRLGSALAMGLVWSAATAVLVRVSHENLPDWKLPGIAIGATILISFAIWRFDRRARKNA